MRIWGLTTATPATSSAKHSRFSGDCTNSMLRPKSRKLLTMPTKKLIPVLFLVAVPVGCNQYQGVGPMAPEETAAVPPPGANSMGYVTEEGLSILMLDVPGKTITLPPEPRPYDLSAAALAEALERAGDRASIGIKAPNSPRAMDAGGYRAPIPGASVYKALEMLEAVGAQIYKYLHNTGLVGVIVDPSLADFLRTHSRVDFIQPRLPELTSTVAG